MAATDELTLTPCASDAELFEKVRYLFEFECQFTCRPAGLLDGFADVVYALDLHLNGPTSFGEWRRRRAIPNYAKAADLTSVARAPRPRMNWRVVFLKEP